MLHDFTLANRNWKRASGGRRTTWQLNMQTYKEIAERKDTCTDIQAWVKQTGKLTETVCLRALDVSSDSSWIE